MLLKGIASYLERSFVSKANFYDTKLNLYPNGANVGQSPPEK